MIPTFLTSEQRERLRLARRLRKYGHLATWKELFLYQYTCATPIQIQEIAEFARRRHELTLPLMFSTAEQEEISL